MARIALALLLLVLVAIVVFTFVLERQPRRPSSHASNAQWVRYYERLASDARRTGDEGGAASYASIAATYRSLDDRA